MEPPRVLTAPFARAIRARGTSLLDALLRGRAWIPLVAVLLVGIVFFNVDLLSLNRDIASRAERSAKIKRQNARLRLELAEFLSSERIQRSAADRGFFLPAPNEIRYLRPRPRLDARKGAAWLARAGKTPAPAAAAGGVGTGPTPTPPLEATPPGSGG